jgi:hypothetical protein
MKIYSSFWLCLLCVLIACQSKSPASSESLAVDKTMPAGDGDTVPAITSIKDTLNPTQTQKSATMEANEGTQTLDWTEINIDFMANCLNPFLAAKRIKSDCTGCDKIMFSFSLVVDGQGKIQTVQKEAENISCSAMNEADKKKLEEEIMVYLKKQTLPASFYNMTYKGNLGFILKC